MLRRYPVDGATRQIDKIQTLIAFRFAHDQRIMPLLFSFLFLRRLARSEEEGDLSSIGGPLWIGELAVQRSEWARFTPTGRNRIKLLLLLEAIGDKCKRAAVRRPARREVGAFSGGEGTGGLRLIRFDNPDLAMRGFAFQFKA